MNVYDFDGTLYRGDSTADFLLHCLRRYPRIATTLPLTGAAAIACLVLHVIDKTRYKRALYRFLTKVPDVESEVERFWRTHERKISGPCKPQPGDLVISGSPEFLLNDICERRGLALIASKVDPHTGKTLGANCSDAEKVVRFRERFPKAEIDCFYSNSHNDDPLAGIARKAFIVDLGTHTITPWSAADAPKEHRKGLKRKLTR